MKRTVSMTLALVLILALCTTASASTTDGEITKITGGEILTNHEYGFSFTVPEGWVAIDYGQRVLLFEQGNDDPVDSNEINIDMEANYPFTIDDLLNSGDAFPEELGREMEILADDFRILSSIHSRTIGEWEVAMIVAACNLKKDDFPIYIQRAILISNDTIYRFTQTTPYDTIVSEGGLNEGSTGYKLNELISTFTTN